MVEHFIKAAKELDLDIDDIIKRTVLTIIQEEQTKAEKKRMKEEMTRDEMKRYPKMVEDSYIGPY